MLLQCRWCVAGGCTPSRGQPARPPTPQAHPARSTAATGRCRSAVRLTLPLAAAARPPAGSVSVSFKLPYHCKFGQKLCLVGGGDKLGGWTVERAVEMSWTEGDVWTVELQLPSE